jgi:HD-like signal output (HDOD) protein
MQPLLVGAPPHDGAEATVFPFTFEDVGVALAKKWGMPVSVIRTMRTYRGASLEGAQLRALTQCSVDVARATLSGMQVDLGSWLKKCERSVAVALSRIDDAQHGVLHRDPQ